MHNDEAQLYQDSRGERALTLTVAGALLAALALVGFYAPGLLVAAVL